MDQTELFQVVGWVFGALNRRCDALASIPFVVKEGDREVEPPPGFADLLWLTEASLCLFGAAFWEKANGPRYLNPATMKVKGGAGGIVGFEQWLGKKQPIRFEPEELVYIRGYHPADDLGPGVPPLAACSQSAAIVQGVNEYLHQVFASGLMGATLVLEAEHNLPDAELKRIKSEWQRMASGGWRTVVLRSGIKPTILRAEVDGEALHELVKLARNEVCCAFGVPPTVLGAATLGDADREHRLSFYYETIIPEAKRIAAPMNRQWFKPRGQRLEFRYKRIRALARDRAKEAPVVVGLVKSGIITREEARERAL